MDWLLLVAIILAIVALFLKKSSPTDPKKYAEKARTDPVDSSAIGSLKEKFIAKNTMRTIEAKQQVATGLGELYKTEGQARVAQKENDLQVLRHDLAAVLEQLQHKNTEAQLIEATKRKVSPAGSEQMIQEEHKTDETIRLEREKSEIEINKTKALQEHEVEVDFRKKMNTLVAITRYRHLQFDAFDEVRGRLVTLLEEVHRIENSNMDAYLKGDIINQMKQAIAAYQEVFDVYRRRLVESDNGEEVGQIGSITELTGGRESGFEATPFKLHSPKPGDRD